SFAVQNNINQYENADVYIIVTQPDGRILENNDIWEKSTITTTTGARLSYTRKVRFDYQKGETKRLLFSLNADEYLSGTYTLQIYHNGNLIGQVMKTLS
ncbi:MAG: hypothetical protein WAT34_01440, partial [Chitinophagaceae bacterium]